MNIYNNMNMNKIFCKYCENNFNKGYLKKHLKTNKHKNNVEKGNGNNKIDFIGMIGGDCWSVILDYKYSMERKERVNKINKELLKFMKKRRVEYSYTLGFMNDCNVLSFNNGVSSRILEKMDGFIFEGFLRFKNNKEKNKWIEWGDYKWNKKMLGCESVLLRILEKRCIRLGRIRKDYSFLIKQLKTDMDW